MLAKKPHKLYDRIREILESARAGVARSVNTAQVMTNWLIGREIVEEEQRGKRRAEYGEKLLVELPACLTEDAGKGWSVSTLNTAAIFICIPSSTSRPKIERSACEIWSTTDFRNSPRTAW